MQESAIHKELYAGMEGAKPYIAMIFIQFVYAGMALFSKAAISSGMNPYVFVFYRQAFASLALAPFAFFFERFNSCVYIYLPKSYVSILVYRTYIWIYIFQCNTLFFDEFCFFICSNKVSPLSYALLCKIFLISLFGYEQHMHRI